MQLRPALPLVLALLFTAPARAQVPGYTRVEVVQVPVDGSSVTSRYVLPAGVDHVLRVGGLFHIGGPDTGQGDAEYAPFAPPQTDCTPPAPIVDIGIAINDPVVDDEKYPFWGAYNPAHEYSIHITGAGEALSFNYHDCYFLDNWGTLGVEIFAPAGPDTTEDAGIPAPVVDAGAPDSTGSSGASSSSGGSVSFTTLPGPDAGAGSSSGGGSVSYAPVPGQDAGSGGDAGDAPPKAPITRVSEQDSCGCASTARAPTGMGAGLLLVMVLRVRRAPKRQRA